MNDRKPMRVRIILVVSLALVMLFIISCIYSAVGTNQNKIDQQVELYSMHETVDLGEDFFSDAVENPSGYSITVNSANLVEYEGFLESLGGDSKEFGFSESYPAPQYTYLLQVTIHNTGNEDGYIMAINYALYNKALKIPVDYSLWGMMDENFPGEPGFRLRANSEMEITIPFTPMTADTGINNKKISEKMKSEEFHFCVSEFPVRKMIRVIQEEN